MSRSFYRQLPYYEGTQVTTRSIKDLLPKELEKIQHVYEQKGELILAAWPALVGERFASYTEAFLFLHAILHVKVKNSVIHSLLKQEKMRLLSLLKKKFPHIEIKNIYFCMT